jgi:hypothetical protein
MWDTLPSEQIFRGHEMKNRPILPDKNGSVHHSQSPYHISFDGEKHYQLID